MIHSLLFSTLYPSSERPGHGIFVETRLRQLLSTGEINSVVVAPVPWFPFRNALFGNYSIHAKTPHFEHHNGLDVYHPRYLLMPKIGMYRAPLNLARAGIKEATRLISRGHHFDIIDAHYFYPDGVAATIIGKALGLPVVITARGSDINLIAQYKEARKKILQASHYASAIIAVSSALREAMISIGIDEKKITVLGNGVDLELFHQDEMNTSRSRWKVEGYTLASVGNLIPTKGHDIVIRALSGIQNASLLIAGQGPEKERLAALATSLGLSDRVHFVGHLTQHDLRSLYSATDCLVLASVREGWPNVILEAMACGASVAAHRVGGVPEIIGDCPSGALFERLTPEAIIQAVSAIRLHPQSRGVAHAHAARHGWHATSVGQLEIFRKVIGGSHA